MPDIYHTSYLRANIVAWLPIHAEDKVLYIGQTEDVTAKKLMEMRVREGMIMQSISELHHLQQFQHFMHS